MCQLKNISTDAFFLFSYYNSILCQVCYGTMLQYGQIGISYLY